MAACDSHAPMAKMQSTESKSGASILKLQTDSSKPCNTLSNQNGSKKQQQQQQAVERRQRRPVLLGRSLSLNVADWAGRWKEAFGLFDKDGDGLISGQELACEMRRLGLPVEEREIRLLLSQWDTDNKGALTLLEFTSLMNSSRCLLSPSLSNAAGESTTHQPSQQQRGRRHRLCCHQSEDGAMNTEELLELRAAFDLFDLDGDGSLNRQEVRSALELLDEDSADEEVNLVMLAADANGNGCVSFKEFCKVLQSGDSGGGGGAQFPGKSTYRARSAGDGV